MLLIRSVLFVTFGGIKRGQHFAVAAQVVLGRLDDLHRPLPRLRVARIHPEKISGEECGFLSARTRSDFEENIFLIIRVLREEQHSQILLEAI